MKEGRCEGPKIAGDILPGGGDWILLGSDRVGRLDVRATLRTDDGAHIYLTNTGRVRMNAEVAQRFAAGEFIPHDEMYARSSPLLDWTLTATAVRWDCLDLVTVTDDWRVARKDTFVDGVQSARALGE